MAIINPEQSSIYPAGIRINSSNIKVKYDDENDQYYTEHEYSYPAKRVRLNIDTINSEWPTDDPNEMTITIPSNPQTDTNNTWDDTTKTLTLTNLDQNNILVTNNENNVNYATELTINLSQYNNNNLMRLAGVRMNNSYNADIPFTSFIKTTSEVNNVTLGYNKSILMINYEANYNRYKLQLRVNTTGNDASMLISNNTYYYILNGSQYLYLLDENEVEAITMYDLNSTDVYNNFLCLSVRSFELIGLTF